LRSTYIDAELFAAQTRGGWVPAFAGLTMSVEERFCA
jgi:hypothetical protein